MPAQYNIGQDVMIKPIKEKGPSVRESALSPFAGTIGKVVDCHWMRPPTGKVFYLYTVKAGDKEIVLYEDEITYVFDSSSKSRPIKD